MAAKLNILNGASTVPEVDTAMSEAEVLFATYAPDEVVTWKSKNGKGARAEFVDPAGMLGSYNEGLIGPGHCDEDETSEPS